MNFKSIITLSLLSIVNSALVCPSVKQVVNGMEGIYGQDKTGITDVEFGFIHQLQFDNNNNYYMLQDFYCPKDVPCPVHVAPVLPTKGKFAIDQVKCDSKGSVSFNLQLTEYVNSLNLPVDANNRQVKTLKVTKKDNKITFITSDNLTKVLIKPNDECNESIPSFAPCDVSTGLKGTSCFGLKCKFVKNIEF